MLYKPYYYLHDGIVKDNEGLGWDEGAPSKSWYYMTIPVLLFVYMFHTTKKRKREKNSEQELTPCEHTQKLTISVHIHINVHVYQ